MHIYIHYIKTEQGSQKSQRKMILKSDLNLVSLFIMTQTLKTSYAPLNTFLMFSWKYK